MKLLSLISYCLVIICVTAKTDSFNYDINTLVDSAKSLISGSKKLWQTASSSNSSLDTTDKNGVLFKLVIDVAANFVKGFLPTYQVGVINVTRNTWWGSKHPKYEDKEIKPFYIHFHDEMINDLKYRLHSRKRFTKALKYSANTYGTNDDILNRVLDYWEKHYNFQEREIYLNRHPQFITNVQGLDIHYVHVKPEFKKTVPLLMLHGWPLTGHEYNKVIDHLNSFGEKGEFALEIIVPDIPGYGYSEPTYKKGLSPYQVGVIFKNLMERLGHKKFYIHAGDVGHFVGSAMSVIYEDDILGFHTTLTYSLMPQTLVKYVLGQLYPPAVVKPEFEDRLYPIASVLKNVLENSGYFHMHATRPDTLGKALEDSPSGLMSWILQLLMGSTEGLTTNLKLENGNLTNYEDFDDIVDTITIYWDTQCITTAIRFYAEYLAIFQDPMNLAIFWTPSRVPVVTTFFGYDVIYLPAYFLKDKYPNLVKTNEFNFGGHTYGFENPHVAADRIWDAVKTIKEKRLSKNI